MKTSTITFAILITLISATSSFASSQKRFRMHLSNQQTIEIYSKVESLVEESLPVITNAICKSKSPVSFVLKFVSKEELPVEEQQPLATLCNKQISDAYLVELVRNLSKDEEEINDLDIDTHAVYQQYLSERHTELTSEEIKFFVKAEQEINEYQPLSSHIITVSK
jgi:hypothetical protein